MCSLLGFTKQAYYKKESKHLEREHKRKQIKSLVIDIRAFLPRIGTRKLYYIIEKDLQKQNIKMGRDGLFRFLREENLLILKRKKYTVTTNSHHWMRKYPNIAKDSIVDRPEKLWVADITYLKTKQGNEYLHLITDAYSKQIMGYELASDLRSESTLKALEMALLRRKYKCPLIHHSDRGLQYCSHKYVELLRHNHINISMTEKSDPYENAIAERVNGILKQEFDLDRIYNNKTELNHQLHRAIQLYNEVRPHQSVEMLTPKEAHLQNKIKLRSWKKKYIKMELNT